MNDYRIIARATSDGNDLTRVITERSEKAARAAFSRMNKETPHEITGAELVKENTNATKQQERDALAKIRAMVEELGPDSYVRTAFEGCFEIADQNIEYDFGDSMKHRVESSQRDADEVKRQLAKAEQDNQDLRDTIAELKETLSNLSDRAEKERGRMLDPILYKNIHRLVSADLEEIKQNMTYLADNMAEQSAKPDSQTFQSIVTAYKEARTRRVNREWIMKQLEAIAPEMERAEAVGA